MTKRAQHLSKTEDLLKDEDVSKDAEYTERYTKEIDILNGMIAKKHHKIKINNETLIKLTNDLYKIEVELNSTKRILEECTKSNTSFT
jgi:cob(I)alamin adenosyltransferase